MSDEARVLIYGMQSSGASLMAFLAAQGRDTLAVIDLWNPEVAPPIPHDGPIVIKATVGPVSLAEHMASFRPTATVLVLRNPVHQIASLSRKSYRDFAIPLEAKLSTLDELLAGPADRFDLVLRYEELLLDPALTARKLDELGLGLPADAARFPRALEEVIRYTRAHARWCNSFWRSKWGTGGLDATALEPLRSDHSLPFRASFESVLDRCPRLVAEYA